ncbi:TIGR02147 family protein [Halobacteriovorax sp. GB3]|uniref:TIGR02147 family protein n=1 Tax=Halobacteriovorax sp. GB3 TaxID=2719615 RepID=UPI002361C8F5|nr:TIGR02147 family protein [Halobacteriovorax sp. GB3]MDD0853988.1 TIGR02147 family protein [Halobacteriovorax sp. GB3]
MIEDFKEYLQAELDNRKKKNSLFSLRAFARNLGISPAQLSQIISGKRPLTITTAKKIVRALKLSPIESETFLQAVDPDFVSKKKTRLSDEKRKKLKEDEFRLICDWEHFAILSLSEVQNNSSDARWIAKRLNIPMNVAADARDRLLRLGIIEIKNSQFRQVSAPLTTTNDIKSESIQRSHYQNLELAMQKLESVEVSKREYTTVTMATNPKKIKEAKTLIREFKRKLMEFLEDGEKTDVYTLAIQLFPLTEKGKKL